MSNIFELPHPDEPGRQWTPAERRRLEGHAAEILSALGLDLDTPGTRDTPRRFLQALYDALDEKRRAAGLSWAGATHAINRFGPDRRAIASGTITGIRNKRVAEGNGVLHMLLWLDRTPESFVPGYPNASDARFRPGS